MTLEQFKERLERELQQWISKRERPESHWMLSLEEWASMQYNKAMRIEGHLTKEKQP